MLLHEIFPEVMARKQLMLFLSFHVAQEEQNNIGAAKHAGDMEVFPCCSLCQWFHCQTVASWCQL
jgi:hypothetical protein